MEVDENLIGTLDFNMNGFNDCMIETLEDSLNETNYEIINISVKPFDICALPNGNLVTASYVEGNVALFDRDLKLIKKIAKINDRDICPYSVTTNNENRIYIAEGSSNSIVMTDFELNYIKLYGCFGSNVNQFNPPTGVYFSSGILYVCDHFNRRIQKLSDNLEFIGEIKLDFHPRKIKIIQNNACINTDDLGGQLLFYDLNKAQIITRYANGICNPFSLNNMFYEFAINKQKLYWYNTNGGLNKIINLKGLERFLKDAWDGSTVFINGSILIASFTKKKLIKICTNLP